jgi:hypothetical protein
MPEKSASFKRPLLFMLMHIRFKAANPLPAAPRPRPPSPLHPIRIRRANMRYSFRFQPSAFPSTCARVYHLTPLMTFSISAE